MTKVKHNPLIVIFGILSALLVIASPFFLEIQTMQAKYNAIQATAAELVILKEAALTEYNMGKTDALEVQRYNEKVENYIAGVEKYARRLKDVTIKTAGISKRFPEFKLLET